MNYPLYSSPPQLSVLNHAMYLLLLTKNSVASFTCSCISLVSCLLFAPSALDVRTRYVLGSNARKIISEPSDFNFKSQYCFLVLVDSNVSQRIMLPKIGILAAPFALFFLVW